jgi:hypothetical protein
LTTAFGFTTSFLTDGFLFTVFLTVFLSPTFFFFFVSHSSFTTSLRVGFLLFPTSLLGSFFFLTQGSWKGFLI